MRGQAGNSIGPGRRTVAAPADAESFDGDFGARDSIALAIGNRADDAAENRLSRGICCGHREDQTKNCETPKQRTTSHSTPP